MKSNAKALFKLRLQCQRIKKVGCCSILYNVGVQSTVTVCVMLYDEQRQGSFKLRLQCQRIKKV